MGQREMQTLEGNFKQTLKTKTDVFYKQTEYELENWENNKLR